MSKAADIWYKDLMDQAEIDKDAQDDLMHIDQKIEELMAANLTETVAIETVFMRVVSGK